jgi:GT2 family glycosyltransferase
LSSPLLRPLSFESGKDPEVLVVILNWNSPEETKAAVASVIAMDYQNLKVAIIENGSIDNSVEILKELVSDRIQLIVSQENLGYTGGCNLGFDLALQSNADYVWLLNSDAVTEANTLPSLVQIMEDDASIGLISPIIAALHNPSKLVHVVAKFDPQTPRCESTKDIEVGRRWMADNPSQIMLLGTALLVRVALVRKIGGFDAVLFAYWEDTDLSLRAIKAGFRNVVDFHSVVYHTERSVNDAAQEIKPHFWYYMARNEIYFWKKHSGFFTRIKPLWWQYTTQLSFLKLLKGNEVSRQAILAGLWDGWFRKTGAYRPDLHMPYLVAKIIEAHSEIR